MVIPLRYSLKSLWARRTTTIATALGIALVVFVLCTSGMLAQGLKKTLIGTGRSDKAIVMSHEAYAEDGSRVRQSVVGLVQAAPGVQKSPAGEPLVTGESLVQVMLGNLRDRQRIGNVQVRGVSDNVFALRPEVRIVAGRAAKPGTDEAIVGQGLVGRYEGLSLGDGFELKKNRKVMVVGVFASGGSAHESEVWMGLDSLRTALGWEGYLSSVTAQLSGAHAFDGFALQLESDKQQGLTVERETEYYTRISEDLSTTIMGLGGLVTFIFSFGAMLGAAITLYGAVEHRSREVGVLRALGFTRLHVLTAFLLEATALALAGGALGVGFALLTPLVDITTMNTATGQELTFPFSPTPGILVRSLLIGTLVGVIGGVFPAIRAARISPARAMRA